MSPENGSGKNSVVFKMNESGQPLAVTEKVASFLPDSAAAAAAAAMGGAAGTGAAAKGKSQVRVCCLQGSTVRLHCAACAHLAATQQVHQPTRHYPAPSRSSLLLPCASGWQ